LAARINPEGTRDADVLRQNDGILHAAFIGHRDHIGACSAAPPAKSVGGFGLLPSTTEIFLDCCAGTLRRDAAYHDDAGKVRPERGPVIGFTFFDAASGRFPASHRVGTIAFGVQRLAQMSAASYSPALELRRHHAGDLTLDDIQASRGNAGCQFIVRRELHAAIEVARKPLGPRSRFRHLLRRRFIQRFLEGDAVELFRCVIEGARRSPVTSFLALRHQQFGRFLDMAIDRDGVADILGCTMSVKPFRQRAHGDGWWTSARSTGSGALGPIGSFVGCASPSEIVSCHQSHWKPPAVRRRGHPARRKPRDRDLRLSPRDTVHIGDGDLLYALQILRRANAIVDGTASDQIDARPAMEFFVEFRLAFFWIFAASTALPAPPD